ncbi:methionine biosynthesis protein MetW [Gammaproteobacteria bacterium]|nr:methionine biosynthesis protein MetW [Gammaproteobacteria bacterium]
MLITDIIKNWIAEGSSVIDFGCGDGSLLCELKSSKKINGYGVEIDADQIELCIENGVSVVEQDIDQGIQDFFSFNFDTAIMASSIQCLKNPDVALERMLDIADNCIVTLPNFGHWRCRIDVFLGRMPVTKSLPVSWYETNNYHLCTIKDFEALCEERGFILDKRKYLNTSFKESWLSSFMPNLFAAEGVYLIAKK